MSPRGAGSVTGMLPGDARRRARNGRPGHVDVSEPARGLVRPPAARCRAAPLASASRRASWSSLAQPRRSAAGARSARSARGSRARGSARRSAGRRAPLPSRRARPTSGSPPGARCGGGERLAGIEAVGEVGGQRLDDGGDGGGVVDGGLRVGDAHLERAVGRVRAQLPPPAAGLRHGAGGRAPGERLRERVPGGDRGRDALARELLADLGADRGHAGVRPRGTGRWRRARRSAGAGPQAVVDGERAVGAADGDVDLERADELAPRDVAVLLT